MNSDDEIPKYTKFLKEMGISFKITDNPNDWIKAPLNAYTHVFIDMGGLSMPGNSMFEHYCLYLSEAIEEHESVMFIIISTMGPSWYEGEIKRMDYANLKFMDSFTDEKEFSEIIKL